MNLTGPEWWKAQVLMLKGYSTLMANIDDTEWKMYRVSALMHYQINVMNGVSTFPDANYYRMSDGKICVIFYTQIPEWFQRILYVRQWNEVIDAMYMYKNGYSLIQYILGERYVAKEICTKYNIDSINDDVDAIIEYQSAIAGLREKLTRRLKKKLEQANKGNYVLKSKGGLVLLPKNNPFINPFIEVIEEHYEQSNEF